MRRARRIDETSAMAGDAWARRDVIRGLAAAVVAAALPLVVPGRVGAANPDPGAPRDREARRRWALGRMDEMAGERQRCRERFKAPRQIQECEAAFERRHRAYNELYLEAARE